MLLRCGNDLGNHIRSASDIDLMEYKFSKRVNSKKIHEYYSLPGAWSQKAAKEAAQYVQVNEVFPKPSKFERIPPESEWRTSPDAAYLYYCDNETIHGVEFPDVPAVKCPVVCDMSSNIMTRPVDIAKFGVSSISSMSSM